MIKFCNTFKYAILLLMLVAFFFFGSAKAEALHQYILTLDEQEQTIEWVKDSAQTSLTDAQALEIVRHVYAYANSANIEPGLILAVMRTESGFIATAKSNHNALGLMQVMPRWHKDKLKGRNPRNPIVSIEVGIKVLEDCLIKHKGNTFKSLNCYGGGGGKKYFTTVNKYQKQLTAHLEDQTKLAKSKETRDILLAFAKY